IHTTSATNTASVANERINLRYVSMFLLKIHLVEMKSFLFVVALLDILAFAVHVDVKILVKLEHALVSSLHFLDCLLRNIETIAEVDVGVFFKLLPIVVKQPDGLRIAKHLLLEFLLHKGVLLLKIGHRSIE